MESEFLYKLKAQEGISGNKLPFLSSLLSTSDKNSTGCDALTTTRAPHVSSFIHLPRQCFQLHLAVPSVPLQLRRSLKEFHLQLF